jgi:hypothetical protein
MAENFCRDCKHGIHKLHECDIWYARDKKTKQRYRNGWAHDSGGIFCACGCPEPNPMTTAEATAESDRQRARRC